MVQGKLITSCEKECLDLDLNFWILGLAPRNQKKKGGENWRGRRNVVKRGREEGEKGKGVKDLVARGNR